MKIYGIIPARMGSKRFPGKPLAMILGKPMIQWVYERARCSSWLDSVIVATDSIEIFNEIAQGEAIGKVVMTRSDHKSGTDRVFEAAQQIGAKDDDIIVNIQGDEPCVTAKVIEQLVEPFLQDDPTSFTISKDPDIILKMPQTEVATLATEIPMHRAQSPDQVKVVMNDWNYALYFSREVIPYRTVKHDEPYHPIYGHIGLYAFRMSVLRKFVSLPQGKLEQAEKLEQLRFLENGIGIKVVLTDYQCHSVDVPDDIENAETALRAE